MSTVRARKAASTALNLPSVDDVMSPKGRELTKARATLVAEIDQLKTERINLVSVMRFKETQPTAEGVPTRFAGRNDIGVKRLPAAPEPQPPERPAAKHDREFRAAVAAVLGEHGAKELAPQRMEDRAVTIPDRIRQLVRRIDILESASVKLLDAIGVERDAALAKLKALAKPQLDGVRDALIQDVLNFHASLKDYCGALHSLERNDISFGGLGLLAVSEFGPITGARTSSFGRFLRAARLDGFIAEKDVPPELLTY